MQENIDPIEYANLISAEAERMMKGVESGQFPDLTNELTSTALSLMCFASGGTEGVDEEAVKLVAEQIINAQILLTLLRMVYDGTLKPAIQNGQLVFAKGIKFDEVIASYDANNLLLIAIRKKLGL